MAVSPAIVDVAVIRPQPCYVEIYPLTDNGAAGLDLRDGGVAGIFQSADSLERDEQQIPSRGEPSACEVSHDRRG
ncbi:hypothetical protein [Labrys sp. 22185]|uniref:hypothetical protein n=1 Tax=Labrys sp. 22185 TaxID=3453888 RepID=UPI003F86E3F9